MDKRERLLCNSKRILRNCFVGVLIKVHNDITSKGPGLQLGVKNEIFWSEIGSGFGELESIIFNKTFMSVI